MTVTPEIQLTQRQREVAKLIAQGLTSEEIATILGISPRTARAHSDEIRHRLGVHRKRSLPYLLQKWGLA